MAAKKNTKKLIKSKRASGKVLAAKHAPKKRATPRKPTAKTSAANSNSRKTVGTKRAAKKKPAGRGRPQQTAALDVGTLESRSRLQSGDLQGVRDFERADSESVDELLEEGNAFEAGIVAGVEEAEDDIEKEVKTHEVPEDDVPEEYLDKD